jgi:hypothetical protein
LRYLIVGGCEKCLVTDWGVQVHGAYISGSLDLSFASATGITSLSDCRFENNLKMFQTSLGFLNLSRSRLIGINARGTRVTGSVFLRNVTATATIDLAGAEIGGQLDCARAQLNAANGDALNAQSALIEDGIIWRNIGQPSRPVSFAAARTHVLDDDLDSWEGGAGYAYDGFTYNRIYGSTDAHARIKWLKKGSYWGDEFAPQPFTELAKVLRELGHDGEARKVLFKREQLLRRNVRDQQHITPNGDISVGLHSIWRDIKNGFRYSIDLLLRGVVGYGHHPFQSLWLLTAPIFLATIPANYAYEEGSFAPNSGPILASADWQGYANTPGNPAAMWSADGGPGQDWETFNRYAYAADLVIPIIDLGQTSAWAPSTTRGWWGKQLWWARWVFITLGWIVTALGAAAITGLIRRD